MLNLKLITVGSLKESYWRDAVAEYKKRLGGFCRPEIVELPEERLPEEPSQALIDAALAAEGKKILAAVPSRSYTVALCVEGRKMSSPALASLLEEIPMRADTLCLIIGSSFGLADEVKKAADLRLSVSDMTFPHQLMRVILLEAVYRAFNIAKGTRYHK